MATFEDEAGTTRAAGARFDQPMTVSVIVKNTADTSVHVEKADKRDRDPVAYSKVSQGEQIRLESTGIGDITIRCGHTTPVDDNATCSFEYRIRAR